ncbi:O-antigen ligase family protein [Methylocella sp. CPCC 101449]|uniref:O-antigen ligase family protein n=1 Tax=Methylocella sp. CPCC 101449 TaxID=2987531 RepID=UPI0028910106|nr:O-antigen ligase family protein [Methylocella sp. CPCC 101449]MDT2022442.1 O-antigen ligase family protein [Methylocella sp. CPCC 101449]
MSDTATYPQSTGATPPTMRRKVDLEKILRVVFALFVAAGSISIIEPSPFDYLSFIVLPLWLLRGFRLNVVLMPMIFLWVIYDIAGFVALMPHWNEPDPRLFQFQSLYLVIMGIFFAMFFSEETEERLELGLKAFTFGCLVSSILGILGYLGLFGLAEYTTMYEGRVSGTFKDPNVFGSYMILGLVYLGHGMITGRMRNTLLVMLGFGIIAAGVFLSFSRGSWGASAVALLTMFVATFLTAEQASVRRRMLLWAAAAFAIIFVAVIAVLSIDTARELFLQRATVTQDYDEGLTGRFGNQLRSLPMLLDLPNGFGPLRFRLEFFLDPHNSYINAFASYGWIGGFAWLILIASTFFIGFRMMIVKSPYRSLAHVCWPALMVLLLQGFQIDIDHWRWVFLGFGMVWGLEAARVRWQWQQRRPTAIRSIPNNPPQK